MIKVFTELDESFEVTKGSVHAGRNSFILLPFCVALN